MIAFKITYDIKLGSTWLANDNANGWSSRVVVTDGDAKAACIKLEKVLLQEQWDRLDRRTMRVIGKWKPKAVRFLSVECVATDVLI